MTKVGNATMIPLPASQMLIVLVVFACHKMMGLMMDAIQTAHWHHVVGTEYQIHQMKSVTMV